MEKKLICLGDSLTFGFGVRAQERWTQLCAQQSGWTIVNEGINGDTTGGMLARLQTAVLPALRAGGLSGGRPHVLVMGGSNDIFYSGSDTAARANLGAMIHQLFAAGVLPMVGVPLPVDARRVPPSWEAAADFSAAARTLEDYCAWLQRYCAAFGAVCVDFRTDFLAPNGEVRAALLLDGLHPTAEGHRLMAARLSGQLARVRA